MKPIVSNVVSTLASMGVSTVVVNVVKHNTPKNLNLYSKLMVGLGTFVLSGVLADICAEKLVEMIDDVIPTKPLDPSRFSRNKNAAPLSTSDIQLVNGAELIQKYVDEYVSKYNPDSDGQLISPELIRTFCMDNNIDVNKYEFVRTSGDDFNRPIKVLVANGS